MKLTICEAWDLLRKIRAEQGEAPQPAEKGSELVVPPPPVNLPPTIDDVAGPGYRAVPEAPKLPIPGGNFYVQITTISGLVNPYFWPGNNARVWFAISLTDGIIEMAVNEITSGSSYGLMIRGDTELQQFRVEDWGTMVTQDWWIYSSNVAYMTFFEGIRLK